MILRASRHIGKYEIRQKLGRGGMADVYLAEDTEQGGTVALKLIEHSADADTRDAIEAERRGAELQARLAEVDPRVVRIYDCGDVDGCFYVAMEYIDGQDLSALMRRAQEAPPLEPEFAVDTALAVARTLENAHNLQVEIGGKNFQGIVHGDIKPKNIRIDAHGEVRVLDFGIAKALSLSRRLTRNEFGSVPYASPERLDSGEVNAQSDLWSLAVMLYEMVTGLQPYQADSTERLERMIRSRIPPPPAPDPCPDALRRILIKAMIPEPELRYQSAREFAEDLEAWRKGGTVRAATEDLEATRRTVGRASGPPTDETRRTVAPQEAPKATRTRKSVPVARMIGALMMVAIAFGGYAAVKDYLLYEHGEVLARQIETEQLTNLNDIWTKWTELSRNNPSSLLLHGPRKLVKQRLVAAADEVIENYRGNAQRVYENDWKSAQTWLARALEVDPDDTVRGKLRLAEGHIARINGVAHHDGAELNRAVEKFHEAQRLLPHSPDPELGLASVYVYGLKDIDKGYQALQDAGKRGFALGNREKLMLADGYRDRADRLWWDSRNVRGLPQEKDQIERARDDYQRALQLYQAVAPYGSASAGIARVEESLDSVNSRLDQIAKPAATPGSVIGPILDNVLKHLGVEHK